jgi:iron(III) transport system substrate-binding protein
MANEPVIRGSDVDVVKAIAAGECDVGLVNHYYLARELKVNPTLPVTPAWPTGDQAGAHTNLSGAGVVKTTDRAADAQRLVEFLVQREAQQAIAANGEFPANKDVPPPPHIAAWAGVAEDPIDVDAAGANAAAAVALMAKVQWR